MIKFVSFSIFLITAHIGAVVCYKDDQRVFHQFPRIELLHELAELGIEVFNQRITSGDIVIVSLVQPLGLPLRWDVLFIRTMRCRGREIDEEGILLAELDLDEIVRAKLDFDVVGHYARPDVFHLQVNEQAANPVSKK